MARQEQEFDCFIQDQISGDKFSASVVVQKRSPLRQTRRRDREVELADVFITPLSGNSGKRHHHFVVLNLNGDGVYIFRDVFKGTEKRRLSSIWELGPRFANRVIDALRVMA